MLACKICLVSLVITSLLATTKSKNDAENKRNIGADIESSNVKPSSPITPLTNSSKPPIFNMMKGFMNTSVKGIYSYNRKLLPYYAKIKYLSTYFATDINIFFILGGPRHPGKYFLTAPNGLCSDDSSGKQVDDEYSCRDAGLLLGIPKFRRRFTNYKYPSGCVLFKLRNQLWLNIHPRGLRNPTTYQVCERTGTGKIIYLF